MTSALYHRFLEALTSLCTCAHSNMRQELKPAFNISTQLSNCAIAQCYKNSSILPVDLICVHVVVEEATLIINLKCVCKGAGQGYISLSTVDM